MADETIFGSVYKEVVEPGRNGIWKIQSGKHKYTAGVGKGIAGFSKIKTDDVRMSSVFLC